MDRYNAIAVVYELAKAWVSMMTSNGYPVDVQEEAALEHVKQLLDQMEKGDGS